MAVWFGRSCLRHFPDAGRRSGAAVLQAPTGPELVAKNTVRQAPPKPAAVAIRHLIATAVNTAPRITAAAVAGAVVDARVLIITADGTDSGLAAIQSTLQYPGHAVRRPGREHDPPLTADRLATGTHGKYHAIFLSTGNLSVSGGSAFTTDEWTTLATYEAQFQARRVALYTSPSATYGLTNNGAGRSVEDARHDDLHRARHVGVRRDELREPDRDRISGWVYPAAATDSATRPLLADAAGNIYAAIRTYPDGREALALTFAQATYLMPYLQLAYGLVSWATRGVFVGERHVYAVPQIDDLFLASTIYTGGDVPHHGRGHAGVGRLAERSARPGRSRPSCIVVGGQRLRVAVAAGRSADREGGRAGPTFAWINHTWDHPTSTTQTTRTRCKSSRATTRILHGLGLTPVRDRSTPSRPTFRGWATPTRCRPSTTPAFATWSATRRSRARTTRRPTWGIWNALQPSDPRAPARADRPRLQRLAARRVDRRVPSRREQGRHRRLRRR